jgi:hypothetical protein
MSDFQPNFIKIVIEIYGLELDDYEVDAVLVAWLQQYDPAWILQAIVESLYRGRYKIVSVDHILKDWKRLGAPRYKFTPEYKREILAKIPQPARLPTADVSPALLSSPDLSTTAVESAASNLIDSENAGATEERQDSTFSRSPPALLSSEHLDPEQSAPFQCHHHSLSSAQSATQEGASTGSPDRNFEDTHPLDNSNPANCHLFKSPPPPLELLQRRSNSEGRHSKVKPERIISQPVNRKLFNTLKAIVAPSNQHKTEVDHSHTIPPLAVGNVAVSHIASFKISAPSANEEQHL